MKNKRFIMVAGKSYRIMKAYDVEDRHYVEYRDPEMKKTIWTRLGITRKTRLIWEKKIGDWTRFDMETFVFWNPLSWLVIFFAFLATLLIYGINGLKEFTPFKPIIDNSEWFSRDKIREI